MIIQFCRQGYLDKATHYIILLKTTSFYVLQYEDVRPRQQGYTSPHWRIYILHTEDVKDINIQTKYKLIACPYPKESIYLSCSSQSIYRLAGVAFIRKTFSCVYLLSLESRKFKPKKITATKASAWYDYIPMPSGQTVFACPRRIIYIIQAWADWRCLSLGMAMREPKRWDKRKQVPTLFL